MSIVNFIKGFIKDKQGNTLLPITTADNVLLNNGIDIETIFEDVPIIVSDSFADTPTYEVPFYPSGEYSDLNTGNKHIIGAINEVKSKN